MNSERGESDPGALEKAYRTVTPGSRSRPNTEMTVIGLTYFLVIVVLLVPLLPFIVLAWVISKVLEFLAAQTGSGEE